jgi:hypothetical protein
MELNCVWLCVCVCVCVFCVHDVYVAIRSIIKSTVVMKIKQSPMIRASREGARHASAVTTRGSLRRKVRFT